MAKGHGAGTAAIVVNVRSLSAGLTGAQRYVSEILHQLDGRVEKIAPRHFLHGSGGHVWEQAVLPLEVGKRLLWSPANTGPLAVRNQVVSILDMSAVEHSEWFSPNFSRWYRFLLPELARRAKRILTISEYSRGRLIELCGIESSKVVVTPLAADQRFYPKPQEDVENVRAILGIPARDYVLALGSLEPRKNLGRLLRAWEIVGPQLPDDRWLVLSGAKGMPNVFRNISFENLPPRVYLSGQVPDAYLPALYSGASAFVYPSLYEGFGLPPLEAMACGTPVIVSNSTSLPEVVGQAGILVDPTDIEGIAHAIRRVLTDDGLRASLKCQGLERSKLFSWRKTAELTWGVLSQSAQE